ncbi:MAG: ParB/RepB/Spo0J family partition protein [Eubacteriaceae bacterium]
MSKSKKGLGKGLNALIPESKNTEYSNNNQEIDINEIVPNKDQPRKKFNEEKLSELAQSVSLHGIIQPIVVSKYMSGYQIIAGERRWRAAMIAGLKKVPVVIKTISDKEVMEIALIENLQREDLNIIEEAVAYKELINKFDITQNEISQRIGKSRVAITNTLRLLQLPEEVQKKIKENLISAGHARAILSVPEAIREKFANKIIKEKLSVRESEKQANNIKKYQYKDTSNKVDVDQKFIIDIQEELQNIFGTKVLVKHGKSKGKIEIEYYSNDELERIIKHIKK